MGDQSGGPDAEDQLDRLERQLSEVRQKNRTLGILVGVVLVGLLGVVGWSQFLAPSPSQAAAEKEDVVRANTFVIEDERGNARALLAMREQGPYLTFANEKETGQISLGISKGKPYLGFADEGGTARALMHVDEGGAPMLDLYDEDEQIRARLIVKEEGPTLMFGDSHGQTRVGITVNEEVEGTGMIIRDSQGDVRVAVSVIKDQPRFSVSDSSGDTVWSAPPKESG